MDNVYPRGLAQRPRVLVTRAANQTSALAVELERLGAETVSIPVLEIVPPDSWEELDFALANLSRFHWIILTSANAVQAVAARAAERGIALTSNGIKISAIGAATARALNSVGWRVDLVPEVAVAESLADALAPFARQRDDSPTRFLLLRAQEGREHLPQRLTELGGIVSVVAVYRNRVPADSIQTVRRCFSDPAGPPQGITLTSSSAARNFFALLKAAEQKLPDTTVIASIGPITSATLRELGHPPHIEAEAATVQSLAEAMMSYLEKLDV